MRTHTMTTAEGMAAGALGKGRAARSGKNQVPRNMILFFAAPFIGLTYIIVLPLVAFGAIGTFMITAAFAAG